MKMKFFALLATTALAFTFACSDSDTTTGAGGTGSGASTSSTGGAGGGGSVDMCRVDGKARADAGDCQAACELLFCCAEQECGPVTAADEDAFVPGCVETCATMMSTIAVVNGEDCAGTVSIVSTASETFKSTCENGIPMGTGGGGGAGGN